MMLPIRHAEDVRYARIADVCFVRLCAYIVTKHAGSKVGQTMAGTDRLGSVACTTTTICAKNAN